MKMTTSIDAVILHSMPYKENDTIIHTYSLEYGKLSFVCKGVKKMNSKNAKGIHLMSLSHLDVNITGSLGSLIRAETLNYYRHIGENILSDAVGQYILEYFYRYEEENAPSQNKYETLVQLLDALNNGYDPLLILTLFQSFILKINGVSVNVDDCEECDSKRIIGISNIDGGFLCKQHIHLGHTYTIETLKFYRHLFKLNADNIDQFHTENVEIKKIIKILSNLLYENAGISFNSIKFIEKLM